jgi:hypothetical protein
MISTHLGSPFNPPKAEPLNDWGIVTVEAVEA